MSELRRASGHGSYREPWTVRVVDQMTFGLCVGIAVAIVGIGAVLLASLAVAVVIVLVGLLLVALIAERAERQRRRLRETLGRTIDEQADRDRAGATEREQLVSQLEFWARHDPLTHLPNRAAFIQSIGDAASEPAPFAVMTVMLTDFGPVVSTYGAVIGDRVLRAVAERLSRSLRGHDTAGKLGAEIFGLLLRGLTESAAQGAGDRLVAVLQDPITLDDLSITVHAQAGLVVRGEDEPASAEELIDRAEIAATTAASTSTAHLYTSDLVVAAAERNRLEVDLRRSIDDGDIVCFYQPLYRGTDGRIASFEALARWRHPQRGMIAPDQFIPLAERSGLIVPLGLAVLTQACNQLSVWSRAGGRDLTVAVNLSARQLIEPGFVSAVRDIVWRAELDPRQIVLEITESLLVDDSDAAVATLWQLRGLGLKLAVDDFGTGYSSLSRLSDMPIDELKIDKSFVDRIHSPSADSAPIVSATVAMGHALGMTVVAEGVETEAQAAFLKHIGCDLLQGYLYGRPLDVPDITPVLSQALFTGTNPFGSASAVPEPPATFVPRVAPSAQTTVAGRVMAP